MPGGRVQILRDDYTGQIEHVNDTLLCQLLDSGYIPVIAPLALSLDGERLNVDGDRVASSVAAALQADVLVIITNVPGLLANPEDQSTLIRSIPTHQLADYVHYAHGRMRKKLLAAQEALRNGVQSVCIGSNSLLNVLNGSGTVIESLPIHAERNLI